MGFIDCRQTSSLEKKRYTILINNDSEPKNDKEAFSTNSGRIREAGSKIITQLKMASEVFCRQHCLHSLPKVQSTPQQLQCHLGACEKRRISGPPMVMLNEYVHFHKNHRIFVCTLESEKHWTRGNYAVDSLSLEAKGKQLCPHACTHTHTHTHCSGANGTTERHPCSSLNYPQAGTQCSAISHPSTPPPLPWVLDP